MVVENEPSDEEKLIFMQQVLLLNEEAPAKGLEMSVVTRQVCDPFQYPTPFVLHFSPMHLRWFREDPAGYIQNMKGTDRDLAAHFTILRAYGKALCGPTVADLFGPVPPGDYLDSIWADVEHARQDILDDPIYITLNLCRVLAYVQDGHILSKQDGGQWALNRVPECHHGLIRQALACYAGQEAMRLDAEAAVAFANEALALIQAARHP